MGKRKTPPKTQALRFPLPILSRLLLHFSIDLSIDGNQKEPWEPERRNRFLISFGCPSSSLFQSQKKSPNSGCTAASPDGYQLGFITRRILCNSYMFQSVHRSSKFRSVHSGQ
ncbi:hypothetical protein MRB53_018900 [Persea americana]|uniref:Uncharacterized protein n=1 Tax=Persea americana TaxID=3435 RepID=A0ACC2M8R9_PERAE|nr:hypothetical protein MRB53_018900 [Persea americana]